MAIQPNKGQLASLNCHMEVVEQKQLILQQAMQNIFI
jgi:hypothetical protein